MEEKVIEHIVKDAIREAFEGAQFPQCALASQRMAAIEECTKKLSLLITGNGDPGRGLVVGLSNTKQEVLTIRAELTETQKDIKEKEKEKRNREWAMIMVGIGLIATSVWNLLIP